MDFLDDQIKRIGEVRDNPAVVDNYVKQRIRTGTLNLSRAGEFAARVEVIMEALVKFTKLVYEPDSDGSLANVDSVTDRLLIPAPFGSSGWKKWGLREWEARVLRRFLMGRSKASKQLPALFEFNFECRTWHLNTHDYASFDQAKYYLKNEPITVKELKMMSNDYKKKRVEAVRASSSRNSKQTNERVVKA